MIRLLLKGKTIFNFALPRLYIRMINLIHHSAIGERMADAADPAPSIRQVRDRLRHAGEAVRKLGAGYYASAARRVDPVIDWAEERVGRQGREPLASFLKATLEAYPHGDAHAISAWLHQGPGRLIVRRGQVCYVDGALA